MHQSTARSNTNTHFPSLTDIAEKAVKWTSQLEVESDLLRTSMAELATLENICMNMLQFMKAMHEGRKRDALVWYVLALIR
jgi:hypothetical protein